MNDDEMEAQMEYWKSKAKAAEAERDRVLGAYHRENDGRQAAEAERDRLIAERQRLTDENDKGVRALWDEKNKFMEALEAEQRDKGFALAEVERLGVLLAETEGERVGWKDRAEAAEAEVQRLREALQALGDATRLLDVMLREPAAKCLMTAEDYRVYVNGAWLGVDEANVKARAALREDA